MSAFDDAVGDMTTDLLTEAGSSCVYIRGNTSTTITLRRSEQPSFSIESTDGSLTEVRPVDFIGLTSALPYAEPLRGDRIKCGSEVFELSVIGDGKVFRQLSPQMTRLFAKRVK